MTTPQPLPPDPETQQQTETQHEAEAVAAIAALLAAASAAGATYMSGQVAQAGIVNTLRGLGLTRKQAGKLVELDAARPAPPVIPLQPSTRDVFRDGPTYRAHYLVNAAKRIVTGVGEKPLGDLVDTERRYFRQHQTAQVQREQAAARIDAAANSYGQLLGWHAVLDDRTTPECRAADGRNFYADRPPAIGLPGLKHAGNCRCYPGPPHENAPLVDPSTAPPGDVAASSTREAVELSAKTAAYSTTHAPLGRPGGPGLWGHKNWQLPAYIQNVAHGIIRTGVPRSKAIAIAVGKVRDWAEGRGDVSPEVRAASVKAIAEWEALRARAKATKLAADSRGIDLAAVNGHHVPGTPYEWFHNWKPRHIATALVYGKVKPHEAKARDLRAVPQASLEHHLNESLTRGNIDAFERLANETDRRDNARNRARLGRQAKAAARTDAQGAHFDRLTAAGVPDEQAVEEAFGIPVAKQRDQAALASLRGAGHDGASLRAAARSGYRSEIATRYRAAEDATNGHMLNNAGRAANIDPATLMTGPESRARKYASDELKEWFDTHGRPTFDEYLAEIRGHVGAARNSRSARSDFLAARAAQPAQEIEMAAAPKTYRYRHGWIPIAPGAGGGGESLAAKAARLGPGSKAAALHAAAAKKPGAPKLPGGKNHASRLAVLPDAKSRRAHAATLSEADLHATDQELTRRAALLGKPGQVASHHKVVKDEIARRKAKTPGKSTDPAVVKAKLAEIDAKKKSGQMTSTVHAQQRMKLLKELGGAERASNASKRRVQLASDNDGVELAMFGGKKPTPKDVRDMVHAHSKVPDQLKEKYRAKVIGHARNANALHHIPPAWLKGKTSKPGGKGKPFGGKQAAPFGSK